MNVEGNSVDPYGPTLSYRLAVKKGVVRACWEDVEFCDFAPVSITGQVTVFIYPVKLNHDILIQVTILFVPILLCMLTSCVCVFINLSKMKTTANFFLCNEMVIKIE